MKNALLLLALGFLFSIHSCQQKKVIPNSNDSYSEQQDSLTIELQKIQDENILPGFAVSVFTKDSVLYQKGFGYSNIKTRKPYSVENVQIIASITKTFIGVSLMKAVENGQLDLDDKVNDILPFKISNPKFPNTPITLRHLATHSSSISSTRESDEGYRFETPLLKENFPEAHHPLLNNYNKTEDLSMAIYLENKLSEQGKWYDRNVFNLSEPGTSYEYSNLGATLLAYCIELKTGQAFKDFTEKLILKPLKMNASTWSLDQVDEQDQVIYYNEIINEVPRYTIVSYPDGGLYSSVSDLTKYFQEMMKGYDGESKLLSSASFQEMMTKQYDDKELTEGLCWDLSMGADLIGHSGNDFGTSTVAYFSPSTGIGRILFSNISIEKEEQEETFYGIYNLLFKYEFNHKASK